VALTIAGSDSGGGAGIQADLKTFATHGVFGTSVVTALTAQNTMRVRAVLPTPTDFVAAQLDAVLEDLPVAAVKTGMLATPQIVALLSDRASELPNLVIDPVLVASSGDPLFEGSTSRIYLERLFPSATLVTPNLAEAVALLGHPVSGVDGAVAAALELSQTGARAVLVKGGHGDERESVDVLWFAGEISLLRAARVATRNTHGTGCTLSAAVAALLAQGCDLPSAVRAAKAYIHRILVACADWQLGAGHGPLSWELDRGIQLAEEASSVDSGQPGLPVGRYAQASLFPV
jgi:hydroxymethylpyrimidine/phosphomethylpyrimidine kinase